MKKGVKITCISLGSLLGLVLIVIGVALWLVFTPARLTSIVNKLSDRYVGCESHFESVDLTLFSTWPDVGLDIHNVTLVNPMEGAPNDTLLQVGSLMVGMDLKSFLKEGHIVVRQLQLDNTKAHLFVDEQGRANYDIFPSSDDTTSSAFELPERIMLHAIEVRNLSATWTDRQHQMEATAEDMNLSVEGDMTDGSLQADLQLACRKLGMCNGSDEQSMEVTANHLALSLEANGDNLLLGDPLSVGNLQAGVKLDCGEMDYRSSGDVEQMCVNLTGMHFQLDAEGDQQSLAGRMMAVLPQALVRMAGNEYCNATTAKQGDLVALNVPFHADLDHKQVVLDTASLTLDGTYRLNVNGTLGLPSERQPLQTDLHVSTNRWNVASLMALLPAEYTAWSRGMDYGAVVQLDGFCKGAVGDSVMPNVDMTLHLSNGHWADARILPGAVRGVKGTVRAQMVPTQKKDNPFTVNAQVRQLQAQWNNSDVVVDATATDALGQMPFHARVKANVSSEDVAPLLPDTLPLLFAGMAHLDVDAHATMAQVRRQEWQQMQALLHLQLNDLDVRYDSIHVATPSIALNARMEEGSTTPAVAFNLATAMIDGNYGSVGANVHRVVLSGNAHYDKDKKNIFDMLQPAVKVNVQEATVYTPTVQQVMRVNHLQMDYADGKCDTIDVSMVCGLSDYHLTGRIEGVEDFLVRKEMLRGRLDFHSGYTDVDQLMSVFSGMGVDKDTLEAQKLETETAANPFIVPKNVDIAFNTHIDNCVAFGNRLSNVGGGLTVNDGIVVLDQMGFICKAARMQLTGVYRTPRFNHLFVGLDFHLLDIQIDELIDMIPTIDTLVPMLKSFKGNADFHLAAETYLFADYKPKYSTMLGAAAISGKDLVVLDNETFDKISSLLMFKKKTENKIDSLDVEMTVFRNELEVYPFLLSMDKYQVCVAGRHTLDNNCNYHLELLKSPLPMRLAVDVKGNIKKPKISLGSVRYAELFKPEKQNKVQERTLEIKRQVRQALERNVR